MIYSASMEPVTVAQLSGRKSLGETRLRGRYRLWECGKSPVFASGSADEPR
jgi:hypothetical protein